MTFPSSSKKNHTFGRTSNVWQYMDSLKANDSMTPSSQHLKDRGQVDKDKPDDDGGINTSLLNRKASSGNEEIMTMEENPVAEAAPSTRNDQREMDKASSSLPKRLVEKQQSPTKRVSPNPSEVIKRIQTLSSSLSEGSISPVSTYVNNAPMPLTMSDPERLKRDISTQKARLYYGSNIALELYNGHFLTVGSPDGVSRVLSLSAMAQRPQLANSYRDQAIFSIVDLNDLRSARPVCYGDSVWIQISSGNGETSWESGGVIGAKVRDAPKLSALSLMRDDYDSIRNDFDTPDSVGTPIPVKAYLPKMREDGTDTEGEDLQLRVRNKSARSLGKWVIRSALYTHQQQHPYDFVYNDDEVYLEQDWFYISADVEAQTAVLRQLPRKDSDTMHNSSNSERHLEKYVVERRAAWQLRLLDSSNGSTGLSFAQQQMEKVLLKAKHQLKRSQKSRVEKAGSKFPSSTTMKGDEYRKQKQERAQWQLASRGQRHHITPHMRDAVKLSTSPSEEPISTLTQSRSEGQLKPLVRVVSDGRMVKNSTQSTMKNAAPHCEEGCSLCQSSTIHYNLCTQTKQVLYTLEEDIKNHKFKQAAERGQNKLLGRRSSQTKSDILSSLQAPSRSKMNDRNGSYLPTASMASLQLSSDEGVSSQNRMIDLLLQQDKRMQSNIEYVERQELKAAEEASAKLSPVAAKFRDKFKHIGLLTKEFGGQKGRQHGIGSHFQKLRSELYTQKPPEVPVAMVLDQPVEELAQEEIKVQKKKSLVTGRLLPTPQEVDALVPIDTRTVERMYLKSCGATRDMLDGFVAILETEVMRRIVHAEERQDRTLLVATLDFLARSAEFVGARRLQVAATQMLYDIANVNVGDFDAIEQCVPTVKSEIESTVDFIGFYRRQLPMKTSR